MISYKRDVLERQSLSEVKMGRGSPICERVHKKIVEYFKNNVPQHQRLCKSHLLQCITSSKVVFNIKHNPPCHLQMPTKALSCKKEAICEHGPEAPSCPVGQGSFKMDCFKVGKFSMVRRVQSWHSCWKSQMLCPQGWPGGRPSSVLSAFSSKASISDGMGVHKFIRYGQLACLEGTINAERYIKVLEQHMRPLQMTCNSAGQCKTTYFSYYNSMAS